MKWHIVGDTPDLTVAALGMRVAADLLTLVVDAATGISEALATAVVSECVGDMAVFKVIVAGQHVGQVMVDHAALRDATILVEGVTNA